MSDVDLLIESLLRRERDEARAENVALKAENESLRQALIHHQTALAERDVEVARLTAKLHKHMRHPDFEYKETRTARKSGETRRPDGEGWEPNVHITDDGRNWERFEFHESEYWMRRVGAL